MKLHIHTFGSTVSGLPVLESIAKDTGKTCSSRPAQGLFADYFPLLFHSFTITKLLSFDHDPSIQRADLENGLTEVNDFLTAKPARIHLTASDILHASDHD